MKKLRFLIAIVLIFSLLPVFGVSATSEQADEIKATETSEFKKLEAFGLISEEDTIFYYENVMRSTFISYIMKCFPGYRETFSTEHLENPFSDVTEGVKEADAIIVAANSGLISGAKGSNFRPYDKITKSEAAKVLVSLLGYSEYAERKGGYPAGYLAMANSLGIFEGCEFSEEGYFTVNGFLKTFSNVLDTEILDVRSVSVDVNGKIVTQTYKALEERTLVYYVLGLFEAKGIVEADEYTAITGKSRVNAGQVRINGYTYEAKDTDASYFVGYNTHYYYKQDRDAVRGELVYIEPYRNNVVNTSTNCIEKKALSKTNFRYYRDAKDNRYNDLKLSKSASLIYNGEQKPLNAANVALLCPKNGTVMLVDNNDDKVYDVIFVMDYRTIMVATASNSSYQITDSFGGATIKLDPEAKEYGVLIDVVQPVTDNMVYKPAYGLYGSYIPFVENKFSSIESGDVLLYAESSATNQRQIKFVKVSRTTVEGTVQSFSKNVATINGKEYELSPSAKYTVSPGEYGIFYLDAFGRIVTKSLKRDVVYGFLNGIDKDDSGFDSFVRAQIFTENGNWVVLDLANTVRTNILDLTKESALKAAKVYDALMAIVPNYRQLITYTVNGDGKINNITLARTVAAYSADEQNAIEQSFFRKVKYENKEKLTRSYRSTLGTLGYDLLIDESTKFIVVPTEYGGNEDEFYIDSLDFVTGSQTFCVYDVSDARLAGVVLLIGKQPKILGSTKMMIVEEAIKTINDNGEVRGAVTGFYNGQKITLVEAENCTYTERNGSALTTSLAKGDVITVGLDSNGELALAQRECSASTVNTTTYANTSSRFYSGSAKVYYVNRLKSQIILDISETVKGIIGVNKNTKYYIYDSAKGTISEATFADIEKGSAIFTKQDYETSEEILIYR